VAVEVSAAFGTAMPVGDEGEAGCAGAGGCVCGTVVGAGLGACGVAMGVCGVPEELLGSEEAGCCAQTQAVSKNNVAARNGERCICFLRPTEPGGITSSTWIGCKCQQLRWQAAILR